MAQEPDILPNKALQKYYSSLESRIGYRLLLGGTRHFGYYPSDNASPFPIGAALRAMEDHLLSTLGLEQGATVLDAGCGVGHVAMHLARKGFKVTGIDIVDRSIREATKSVKSGDLQEAITIRKMDYHHLDGLSDRTFDGIYTVETFVHATNPEKALGEFFRVLKPGGSIALYEYDHGDFSTAPKDIQESMKQINQYAAMPANDRFDTGVLQHLLQEAGFEEVAVKDLTGNITPMLRLFFILAYVPFLMVKLFGLEARFVNTVTGVEAYRGRMYWRYVAVSARKPRSVIVNGH
jgi:sterol 24-C-methyltransferase